MKLTSGIQVSDRAQVLSTWSLHALKAFMGDGNAFYSIITRRLIRDVTINPRAMS